MTNTNLCCKICNKMENKMKKILSLLLCAMFGFAIFLTGCGTGLAEIQNDNDGIIYNGGAVAEVGDYLFFANGFKSDYSSIEDNKAYNESAKYAGISRVALSEFEAEDKYTTSEKVGVLSNSDVAGFSKTYMFVYGNNIYYVCPSTHKTSENKNAFDYLSIFKAKTNGAGKKEIYTTKTSFDTSNGKLVAIEYNNIAYILLYDGENLVSLDITNSDTKIEMEDVTSVALPQENANWNGKIYYTKDKENADSQTDGNEIYSIVADGTEETRITKDGELSDAVTFSTRIDDNLFYTISDSSDESSFTYVISASDLQDNLLDLDNMEYEFYPHTISNVKKVDCGSAYSTTKGYLYTAGGSVFFQNTVSNSEPTKIIDSSKYSSAKVIAQAGAFVYFSTSSGIYKVSLLTNEVTTIIKDMTITTDIAGYTTYSLNGEITDLKDIYFYATRTFSDDATDEEKEDTNIYLYQVSATGGEAQIFGKTIK